MGEDELKQFNVYLRAGLIKRLKHRGFGNLGEGCPRPSAYVYLRQQVSERTRAVIDGLCGCAAISPDLRFEVKELGEIDMVSIALVAAIDTELLEPPDSGTGSWLQQDWRSSPYTGPVDVFGPPPAMALPATVVQRRYECGMDERLAGALRELLG